MRSRTRRLNCFFLNTLCSKTKHLRCLVWDLVQGFEWLKVSKSLKQFFLPKNQPKFLTDFRYCPVLPIWPTFENAYRKLGWGTLCYIYFVMAVAQATQKLFVCNMFSCRYNIQSNSIGWKWVKILIFFYKNAWTFEHSAQVLLPWEQMWPEVWFKVI